MDTQVSPLAGLTFWQISLPVLILIPLAIVAILFEPDLFLAINGWTALAPDAVWVALSLLGNGWIIAAILLPFVARFPQLFFAALMTAPLTALVAKGAKLLFSTPRPPSVLAEGSFHVIGEIHLASSMPSGHTLTAVAVVAALTRMPNSPFTRFTPALYVLAALVGLSRIGMGVHWPEDVLAGAGIGWLCGLIAAALAHRWFPAQKLAMPESGFAEAQGQGAGAALRWALIGCLPALALFTLDEDRGLLPALRLAFASLALITSLWLLWQAWQRRPAS